VNRWRESFGVYADKRMRTLLFLGFSSGLPLALVFATLSAWLTDIGLSLRTIGFISLVGIAYSLKFLWAPIVDRMKLPVLSTRFGRRRAWMLISQFAIIGAIIAISLTDPSEAGGLWWTVFWAVALAFASATQDIVIDAYRTEILEEEKLGAGAASLILGYRVAMLTSGGGALIVAQYWGWGVAYAAMAVLMGIGVVTTLRSLEPDVRQSEQSFELESVASKWADRHQGLPTGLWSALTWTYTAVFCPFREFATRPGWVAVLLFVALYKYGDALLGVMATPFYLKIGFSLAEVGVISKGFGLVMTLVGAAIGGLLVARLGILKALLICGLLQAASNLVFAIQAAVGADLAMLSFTIGFENLTGGMGTTAFVAYLSSLCNVAYTATQYALLSSLMATTRTVFASGGGWLAEQMDWVSFFLVTTLAALPGLVLLVWMMRRYPVDAKRVSDTV